MADCTKCASYTSCERVWKGMSNPMCVGFEPIRTNADRIRAMPDEELRDMFFWIQSNVLRIYASSDAGFLGWLQQEAKNDRT